MVSAHQGPAVLPAVANLLQNAIEFTPRGGRIAISVEHSRDTNEIAVRIEDDGPGVPAYAAEKIFGRFFSLPRPDTGQKSSGLGLTFVREVAELHEGSVALTNRPGGGATALFRLPCFGDSQLPLGSRTT